MVPVLAGWPGSSLPRHLWRNSSLVRWSSSLLTWEAVRSACMRSCSTFEAATASCSPCTIPMSCCRVISSLLARAGRVVMALWGSSRLIWVLESGTESLCGGTNVYIGPTVGAKCTRRLTRVVFISGLSARARAPSFCSVCEYLKRSEQKGRPHGHLHSDDQVN